MSNDSPKLVHHFLASSSSAFPEKTALVHESARINYWQLHDRSRSVAGLLRGMGVKKGDRVAFALPNGEEYVELYYGTLIAGAVSAPLNTGLHREQMARTLSVLQPAILFVASRFRTLFAGLEASARCHMILLDLEGFPLPQGSDAVRWEQLIRGDHREVAEENVGEDDLASIIYTSGSTSDPKGVMLTHRNIVSNTESICQYLEIGPEDCQMVVLPFYYVMGKSLLNTHIRAGAKLVINNRFTFTSAVLAQMAEEEVTAFSGVPSTYTHLLHRSPLAEYRDKLPRLRYCTQAGGHMPREIKAALRRALPQHTKLFVMYGATEASARLTYLPPELLEQKPDSIGIPIPGVDIRILDAEGREAGVGEIGEIVAQGPNIMLGYFRDPAATREKLSAHGLRTGDLGFKDADGFLHVVGRNDDLVKIRGHRVNPQEIVEALIQTRFISETCVYAVPDELDGNRFEALAVPVNMSCTEADVLAECRRILPRFKCPRRVIFTKSLPKFPNGKIDRKECERMARETVALEQR